MRDAQQGLFLKTKIMEKKNITSGLEAFKEIQALYDHAHTPEEIERAQQRQVDIQNNLSPEEIKVLNKASIEDASAEMAKFDTWMAQAEDEKMRENLGRMSEAVSMSYIAKTYFCKSRRA